MKFVGVVFVKKKKSIWLVVVVVALVYNKIILFGASIYIAHVQTVASDQFKMAASMQSR